MVDSKRFGKVLAAAFSALLISCTTAWAETLSAPDLTGSPSVSITPDQNGIAIDLAAGDTAIQAGAGPGGVTLTRGSRGSSASPPPSDSAPVRGPVLEPSRRPAATQAGIGGDGATVIGPSTSPGRSGSSGRKAEPSSTGARSNRRSPSSVASSGGAADKRSQTGPSLFFDRLDRIPGQIWAGLVALAVISLALWVAWGRDRRRLSGNAFVDPVTGIANAAAFNRTLDHELDRARRFKRPLGLLVLEIREPEHEDGMILRARDTTMRQASDAISERIREADTVARLDDDRFAVISPEATAISAATLARALERRLEELRIHARVGIAEREATDRSARDLLARAEPASGTEPAPRSKESKLRVLRAA